jgi:hypothetical protein
MATKLVATILAIGAAIVIGVAAFQVVSSGANVDASELPDIVVAPANAPEGMDHDGTEVGRETLVRPIISVELAAANEFMDQPGFVAGRYTEFSHERAGMLSWAVLFETVEEAETALGVYVTEVQSPDGYGLVSRAEVELGDEGAFYSGGDPEFNAQVYLWRLGNLVLAAATYGEFDAERLRAIAEGMDDRAR